MNLRRVTVATTAAVLILAAPAAASSTAAAGPSPTPLILELILAAVVVTGMVVRRPVSRAIEAVRRGIAAPRTRATTRARARRA
jgi:hypothetical protein